MNWENMSISCNKKKPKKKAEPTTKMLTWATSKEKDIKEVKQEQSQTCLKALEANGKMQSIDNV